MCGIAGSAWTTRSSAKRPDLGSALHAMKHRGPDDTGEYWPQQSVGLCACLGQTRLSIIDLSEGGHQPMLTEDGRFAIVFNGEIYNYRELRASLEGLGRHFRSDSDTEVLLQAWAQWGEQCLPMLTGMFAFAVYDTGQGSLTLARDAFGIKPLFYAEDGASLFFASEVDALRRLSGTRLSPNFQRVYAYTVHGRYDIEPDTFFAGVMHLPPAHLMTISVQSNGSLALSARRWWWPDVAERSITFADAADQLREMFLSSVRIHLRSDVQVGAALSGGVDSSSIVSAIRHLEPDIPLKTFSYVARGSDRNEEPWVDLIEREARCESFRTELMASDLASDIDDVIRTQGEPFGSTSIYAQYRVYRLARDHGVTVTLDGQGADELFAGYFGYPGQRLQSLLDQHKLIAAASFYREWKRWPGRSASMALKPLGGVLLPASLHTAGRRLIGHDPTPAWLDITKARELGVVTALSPPPEQRAPEGRRLPHHLRYCLTGGPMAQLLRHGDRNSMRWSVESRVPFLTIELAEFALSLPEEFLVSPRGETKHVFRAAMRGIVPDAILDRRDKIGFETPEQEWLTQLRPTVVEWLEGLHAIPMLNIASCRQLVERTLDGRLPFSWQTWRLINLARWSQVAL